NLYPGHPTLQRINGVYLVGDGQITSLHVGHRITETFLFFGNAQCGNYDLAQLRLIGLQADRKYRLLTYGYLLCQVTEKRKRQYRVATGADGKAAVSICVGTGIASLDAHGDAR